MNKSIFGKLIKKFFDRKKFPGSEAYWIQRYLNGGNSGSGSYSQNAVFKSSILNKFVIENNIQYIIEFGCGDGNQLKYSQYPKYLGFDISQFCIDKCRSMFREDPNKSFKLMKDYLNERAELTLSLDVIYHLVEDDIFEDYMKGLFLGSEKFVIIYSTNTDKNRIKQEPHVKHRIFTQWVSYNQSKWKLVDTILNPMSSKNISERHFLANFYIYQLQG